MKTALCKVWTGEQNRVLLSLQYPFLLLTQDLTRVCAGKKGLNGISSNSSPSSHIVFLFKISYPIEKIFKKNSNERNIRIFNSSNPSSTNLHFLQLSLNLYPPKTDIITINSSTKKNKI